MSILVCPDCRTSFSDSEESCPRCAPGGRERLADLPTLPLDDHETAHGHNPGQASSLLGVEIAGRYRPLKELGRGGFGVVYRALDQRLGREIAIKISHGEIDRSSEMAQRFEREARILARLDHPNIVPIYDLGFDGDQPYIAMKMIQGGPMTDEGDAPDHGRCLEIVRQVARALVHAHARGVIHRDIKISNILQDLDGKAVLADFGLSTANFHSSISHSIAVAGTLDYMPPEALTGTTDERSDLYSLGAVLYKLLFGRPCFTGRDQRQFFWKICNEKPPLLTNPPPATPEPVLQLLGWMLQKEPQERPRSAEHLLQELDGLLEHSDSSFERDGAGDFAPLDEQKLLDQLEATLEQIDEQARNHSFKLDHTLERLSQFESCAHQLLKALGQVHGVRDPEETYPIALSLFHLAREVKRRVTSITAAGHGVLEGPNAKLQTRIITPTRVLLEEIERASVEPPETDFFSSSTDPLPQEPPDTEWIDDLLSSKELSRYEAALTAVGSGLDMLLRELALREPDARQDLLQALWGQTDTLLLEGQGRARRLFEALIELADTRQSRDPWRLLYAIFQHERPQRNRWSPEEVGRKIRELPREDQRIFGRALLLHPWRAYRTLALDLVEPSDSWFAISHERVPLEWILELWLHLRPKVDNSYLKVFFICVKDRVAEVRRLPEIHVSIEFIKEFYRVGCFHETTFFNLLAALEKAVRQAARRHHLLIDFDREYIERIQEFGKSKRLRDQPVEHWGSIPLPVQRLLARRGHFLRHFASHPIDPIALECLPHLAGHEEISDYLALFTINSRLLIELAKMPRFFQFERAKFLLTANPKTPSFIVAKHIGYLRTDNLKKLSTSRELNSFAREHALRLLERRGKFRASSGGA